MTGRSQGVLRSTVLIIGGEMACRVIAFFNFIIIARCLGVESFGQYAFVFSFLSFFDIMAMFGMNSIVLREMAGNAAASQRILKNAFLLRSIFILAAVVAACVTAFLLPLGPFVKVLVCLGSVGLIVSYRPLFEVIFRIRMTMLIPVGTSVVKSLLFLGLTLPIMLLRGSVVWFVLAGVAANLAGTAILAVLAVRDIKPAGALDWGLCRSLVKESMPLVFSGLLTILYIRIDVIMLTFMQGFQSVGFYSTATKISETLSIIPTALMATIFPVLSGYAGGHRERFREILVQGFMYLLVLILPLAILLSYYARSVIDLLFKSQFDASAQALSVLVWSCVFVYPNVMMVNAVIALRKQIWDTWFSLASLAVNIGLNFWWIPVHGFLGSAWATVCAELVQFVCLAWYLCAVHRVRFPWGACLRLAGLGTLFYASISAVSAVVPWGIAIPFALAMYVPAVFLFGILHGEDRRFLRDTVLGFFQVKEASGV